MSTFDDVVKRVINNHFPAIAAGLHLPLWGKIITEPALVEAGPMSEAEPRYCVDVAIVKADGSVDSELPLLEQVPLPAMAVGQQRGIYGFPEKDAIVEIGFIMGLPNKPFIKTVLTLGKALSKLDRSDLLLQRSEEDYICMDSQGNISEKCQGISHKVAMLKQQIMVEEGGTVWLGSTDINVLDLQYELIQIVQDLAEICEVHTHEYLDNGAPLVTGQPTEFDRFQESANMTQSLSELLARLL